MLQVEKTEQNSFKCNLFQVLSFILALGIWFTARKKVFPSEKGMDNKHVPAEQE